MARSLRIEYPGAWYHVMNRGAARQTIFKNEKQAQLFIRLLIDLHQRYQIEIHAYCLMKNHYHLLIRTPFGNLSKAMRHLNGLYTQRFNNEMKRDGPLFRGRFKSIVVDADAYLLRLSRYIHLNPVKAGIVKKAEQFRWSSYRAYLSGRESNWLNTKTTLDYFGSQGRSKYRFFVEEGIDQDTENFYKKIRQFPVLGAEDFTKTITEKYLQERYKIREIPDHKLLSCSQISVDNVMEQTAKYYQINKKSLMQVKHRSGNLPRSVAMYLSHRIGHHTLKSISNKFGCISDAGVSLACRRVEHLIKSGSYLKEEINYLIELLKSS